MARTRPPKTGADVNIIRLKVTLRGVKPPVWRRLVMPGTMTLGDLHEAIQAAMGWRDCHLHAFDIGGEHVEKLKHTIEPEVDYLYVPDVNQNDLPIYDFVDRINRRSLFTYGFTSRLLAKLDRPPPIDQRRPLSIGDLNSFSGVTPSPFGDENQRGGLSALGNPNLSGPTPSGTGSPSTLAFAKTFCTNS